MAASPRTWSAAGRTGCLAIGMLVLAACAMDNSVNTFLFYGPPLRTAQKEVPAVVKQPRREKYQAPPPRVKYVEVPDLPPAIDWKGIYDGLPRQDDRVAWVKALEGKAITPKAGIGAEVKDEEPTDLDVELDSSGPDSKAVFPHKGHTLWMGCTACHTSIFEMEKGKAKMTMAGMGEGQWCGACHGKVALPEITTCGSCHPGMK